MIESDTLGLLERMVVYEPNRSLVDEVTNPVIPQAPAGNILISKFDYTNDHGGRRINREDSGTAFASTQANMFKYIARRGRSPLPPCTMEPPATALTRSATGPR